MPPSQDSLRLAQFYQSIENRLVQTGFLRTDGGQTDAPFGPDVLARNFERIALASEYTLSGTVFVAQERALPLRRWNRPVRLQPHFGAGVDDRQRLQDRAILGVFADRLRQVTDHPIEMVDRDGNFHVIYANLDEQRALGPMLQTLVPNISQNAIATIETLPRAIFCVVFAFSDSVDIPNYHTAIAIIRDEHPDLLRRSCVHEEIAQGLGLPNDSPDARPSIFNDDEEFAFLTPHDELLLSMLYDPRLRVGMTAEQARPIIRTIAHEFFAGEV
jgi:hypothetical protein